MKLSDALKKEYSIPFLGGADSPRESDIPRIVRGLSLQERIMFWGLFWLALTSVLGILARVNGSVSSIVPVHGGAISEGIVGNPRFVNPLLAVSEADKDLTALLYSGLLRVGESGELVPDLAESYSVSSDGLTYVFTLRPNLRWHDGAPITADDIVFTVKKITDPVVKSSRRASWEGVRVEKLDDRTVEFSLQQPYSPFAENATLGIIPKHIWDNIPAEEFGVSAFNVSPVGSGPYRIESIARNETTGMPEYYDLKAFENFALGEPYIDRIRLRFYPNETALGEAFGNGAFELVGGLAPDSALIAERRANRIVEFPLTRVFGVFFNQDHARIFTSLAVRRALHDALDSERIVEEVLHGYGSAIEGPIPPGALGHVAGIRSVPLDATSTSPLELAAISLVEDGWKRDSFDNVFAKSGKKSEDRLSFHLATADVPELKAVAQILKETWERLGADVEIRVFETGDLNQNVIRPRDYDALLFGEITGRDPDPFAFWHSSQRLDPGLNIALYANVTVDKLLEGARKTQDRGERIKMYKEFQEAVGKDIPALFLYAPNFLYVVPDRVRGISPTALTVQSERYVNVHRWHLYTENVWQIFNP